jgi:hypothetical protein
VGQPFSTSLAMRSGCHRPHTLRSHKDDSLSSPHFNTMIASIADPRAGIPSGRHGRSPTSWDGCESGAARARPGRRKGMHAGNWRCTKGGLWGHAC